MTPYQEALQHPLWQKKRLEILEAADWRCVCCGNRNEQLHAHHIYYYYGQGRKPWEYDNDELVSLCDDCHTTEHEFGDAAWRYLKRQLVKANCFHSSASCIADGFDGIRLENNEWHALGRCIRMIIERRKHGADLSDVAREIEEGDRDQDAGRDDEGYDAWIASGKPDITPALAPTRLDGLPF